MGPLKRDDIDEDGADEDDVTIPVYEEQVRVGKKRVETHRVRVKKDVLEKPYAGEELLAKESYEVERIPVGEYVEQAPSLRQEGDVTVIPVVEEVVEVRKRLLLKEEIRITKKTEQVSEPVNAVLRQERVQVDRMELPAESSPQVPGGRTGEKPWNGQS